MKAQSARHFRLCLNSQEPKGTDIESFINNNPLSSNGLIASRARYSNGEYSLSRLSRFADLCIDPL
ncbi:MAG: hypothetical protein AUI36_23025 [Cyanobacteria bacterium 13_1_40CM_2_61_4]|nr:MAG: hypothetical protein AUI36_23025 [Cyanobacteria bacterium 13_1_40CM_2_61_4]